MTKKKISIPRKTKTEIEKYPMVSIEWYDIVSDSSWSTFEQIKKAKGVTRVFGDYSFGDDGKSIESIGNTTIIPNSVIKDIKKLT